MSASRYFRHALLALALVCGMVTLGSAPAQAVATGSLSGTVLDRGGDPVPDIDVTAYRFEDDWYQYMDSAATDSAGSYRFGGLEPGSYFLRFTDNQDRFADTWSSGRDEPVGINSPGVYAVDGTAVTAHPVRLDERPNAELTGHVQDPSQAPLDGVLVEAFPEGSAADAEPVASSITYGGEYGLWVASGRYRLEFGHLSGGWSEAVLPATAVRNDSVTLETVTLERATSFVAADGRVLRPHGQPVAGVNVELQRVLGSSDDRDYRTVAQIVTDANGRYSFDRLVPGKRYTVRVSGIMLERWLGSTGDFWDEGTTIFRAEANNHLVDVRAPLAPTVKGHVSDSSPDHNAEGVRVTLHRWESWSDETGGGYFEWEEQVRTDSSGNYSLRLSRSGTYTLRVSTYGSSSPGATTWWGSAVEPRSGADQGAFAVADEAQLEGKDVLLPDATRITGVVSDSLAPDQPKGVYVESYRWTTDDDGGSYWEYDDETETDKQGRYLLRLSQPGTYTLSFSPPDRRPGRAQWLGNLEDMPTTTADAKSVVVVKQGQLVSDVDITLPDSPVTTGRILSDAQPLGAAEVYAYTWREEADWGGWWDYAGHARTSSDGSYRVKTPASGRLTFRVTKRGYISSWLGGSTRRPIEPTAENSVTLTGDRTSAPDYSLTRKPTATGSLSGTVTSGSGPTSKAGVHACPTSGGRCAYRETDAKGTFNFEALKVGDWALRVWPASADLFPGGTTATVRNNETATVSVVLQAPKKMPPGGVASVGQDGGRTTTSGVPSVYYGLPITLKVKGPAGVADPYYTIAAVDGSWSKRGQLTYQNGDYVAVIPKESFQPGDARITTNIPGPGDAPVAFNIYIDPSGIVTDQFGQLRPGAVATLMRSDTETGSYTAVPDGSAVMSPSNRANPMTTSSDARFHWDVTDGWYRVDATDTGCTPGSTPVMEVPPERINLVLQLTCSAPAPTTAPTLGGSGRVGEQLTVTEGVWNGTFDTRSYQWLRGDDVIEGATSKSYTVKPMDLDKRISVRESVQRGDFVAVSVTTGAITGLRGTAPTSSAAPSITGTPTVGSTLTASPGTWSTNDLEFGYQWTRDGSDIPAATAPTYKLTAADAGRKLGLRVEAKRNGYTSGTAASTPLGVAKVGSSTLLRMLSNKLSARKRGTAVVSVSGAGVTPLGPVTVLIDRRLKTTGTLVSTHRGVIKLLLPKLRKGAHSLQATYAGSPQVNGSTSRAIKVKVGR